MKQTKVDRNNRKTKLPFSHTLCNISKHYSFLGCERFMSLSLIQIHNQTGTDVTYSTIIKQASAWVCFYSVCNLSLLDLAFKVLTVKWFLMNPGRTCNEEGILSKSCPALVGVGGHKMGHKCYSVVMCDHKHQLPQLSWPRMTGLSDCCTLALALLCQGGCEVRCGCWQVAEPGELSSQRCYWQPKRQDTVILEAWYVLGVPT